MGKCSWDDFGGKSAQLVPHRTKMLNTHIALDFEELAVQGGKGPPATTQH